MGAVSVSGYLVEVDADFESEDLKRFVDGNGMLGTTSGTACAAEPVEVEAVAVAQEGGEGVGILDTPPPYSTGLGEQKIFSKGSSSQEATEELSTN